MQTDDIIKCDKVAVSVSGPSAYFETQAGIVSISISELPKHIPSTTREIALLALSLSTSSSPMPVN